MPSLISRVFTRHRCSRSVPQGYSTVTCSTDDQLARRHGELSIRVTNHTEIKKHTQYHVECSITWLGEDISYFVHTWALELRLKQFRKHLHEVVKQELGGNYKKLFKGAHFARHGGLSGTTSRLNMWLSRLARNINLKLVPPTLSELVFTFLGAPDAPQQETPVSVEQPISPMAMLVGCSKMGFHLSEEMDESSSMQLSTQGESSATSIRTEDDDDSCADTWSDLGLSDSDTLGDACESEEADTGRYDDPENYAVPWIANDELPVVDLERLGENCIDDVLDNRVVPFRPSADRTCTNAYIDETDLVGPSTQAPSSSKQEALDSKGVVSTIGHQLSEVECKWGVRLRRTLTKNIDICDSKSDAQVSINSRGVDAEDQKDVVVESIAKNKVHRPNETYTEKAVKDVASKFLEKLRARKEIVDPQKISGRGMLF